MPIFDKPAVTTARFRGKTLIAWFGSAVSPVLWRWQEDDISGGFALRDNAGAFELVQNVPGAAPMVVAAFSSREKAERALNVVSMAMMSRASVLGRLVRGALIVLGVLFILIALRDAAISLFMPVATGTHTAAVRTQPQSQTVRDGVAALPGNAPAAAPARPAGPSQGAPVDVDSLYR